MKKNRFKNIAFVVILFFIIPLLGQGFLSNLSNLSINYPVNLNLRSSGFVSNHTSEWLQDTGFDNPSSWSDYYGVDSSDMNVSVSGGEAQFEVNGDVRTFNNISGKPQPGEWKANPKEDIVLKPVDYGINDSGCWVSHWWDDPDNADQLTCIQWDKNISLDVDMSDYNITSVSFSAQINATVHSDSGEGTFNGDHSYPGIETSTEGNQQATGDYIIFYAMITDIYNNSENEIASYQTVDLGDDSDPVLSFLYDTAMINFDDDTIITHIKDALNEDPNHRTFTITLGVQILCEDNWNLYDYDVFDLLVINECNLSFTYEKIIDQFASGALNQNTPKISDISDEYDVQVTDATLNFYYKIDQDWPISSPNAEIRALINENPHLETIKLSNANNSYQIAKVGGFNIIPLITKTVNFSIQIYLRDEFQLNRTITVSIDNVSLIISYNLLSIDVIPEWVQTLSWIVAVLAIVLAAVGSYFLAYQTYLKYPKFVRLIRGLRKKVRKGKSLKNPLIVRSRERIVNHNIKEKMKILRIEPNIESSGGSVGMQDKLKNIEKTRKGGL